MAKANAVTGTGGHILLFGGAVDPSGTHAESLGSERFDAWSHMPRIYLRETMLINIYSVDAWSLLVEHARTAGVKWKELIKYGNKGTTRRLLTDKVDLLLYHGLIYSR